MSSVGKSLRAVLAGALICTTLGVSAVSSTLPAEAHQGTIKVIKTECVDGNTMKATYQWSWSSVPTNSFGTKVVHRTGTTSFEGNWGGSGGSSLVTVNTASGDTTWTTTLNKSQFSSSNGPWEYVYAPWSDGYTGNRYNDTRVENFNWDNCRPPKPTDTTDHQKIEKCDLTSYGNNFKPGIIERDGVATYSWNGEKWILGDMAYGKWAQTKVYTDDEYFAKCAPDNPGPKVSKWMDGKKSCTGVEQSRTVTTFKWDPSKKDYVVDTVTPEYQTRPLTDDEFWALNCIDKPEPKKHTDPAEDCDLKVVGFPGVSGTAERIGFEPYVKSGREWVLSGQINWGPWQVTHAYTDQEYFVHCAGQPEPDKVVTTNGEWTGAPDCVNTLIFQTREVVTVTTKQVWNLELRMYVWGTPITTKVTETAKEPITLTDDQVSACHAQDAPTVTVFPQTCKVGDQGVGQLTGGSISLALKPGMVATVKDSEGSVVTDLTNVKPGTYSVTVVFSDLQSWKTPLVDGWNYLDRTRTTIVSNVTVGAAEDCTIQKPPPNPSTYEWGQEAWKCGDTNAITNGLRIDFVPTWIDGKWVQVAQAPVAVSNQRLLTEAEIVKVCTPASKVEFASSKWKDETIKCGDTKVTQTRYTAKWEIPFVIQWNEDGTYTFVANYDAKVLLSNTKETQTRDLKSSEITKCPSGLAYTGVGPWLVALGGTGAAALLLGFVLVAVRRRGQSA